MLQSVLANHDAGPLACDFATGWLDRYASTPACSAPCTPSGLEIQIERGSVAAATRELEQRVASAPGQCHQAARLQIAQMHACVGEPGAGPCVPDYEAARQVLAPLRCAQLGATLVDACSRQEGQFEAVRVGLVLLSALTPQVQVDVAGSSERVEVLLRGANGMSWPLASISSERTEPQRQVGVVAAGSYTLLVYTAGLHRAVTERPIAVGLGQCAWTIDAPSAPIALAPARRESSVVVPPSEKASSRSWVLPGIWLGSVAGLVVWSLYAHGRASSLTDALDRCQGDRVSCRFEERRRDIEGWDEINKDTAYWAIGVGGFGLVLGGVAWLVEAQASTVRSAASLTVGLNHVGIDVRY